MKVSVDRDRCEGHARCWIEAPAIFQLDDGGYCQIEQESVPAELHELARRGAAVCPERAIHVESEEKGEAHVEG